MDELLKFVLDKGKYLSDASLRYLSGLVKHYKPKLVVELGTYVGCSAIYVSRELLPDARLISIDWYDELLSGREKITKSEVARNISRFGDVSKVALEKADTRDCEFVYKELSRKIDLLFMDACHDYEGLCKEYLCAFPYLNDRHILVVDDVVVAEVSRFCEQLLHNYYDCHVEEVHRKMFVAFGFISKVKRTQEVRK